MQGGEDLLGGTPITIIFIYFFIPMFGLGYFVRGPTGGTYCGSFCFVLNLGDPY